MEIIGDYGRHWYQTWESVEPLPRAGEDEARILVVTVLYALEINAFFDAVTTLGAFSEIEAFRNYLFEASVSTKIFWGVLTDTTDAVEAIERHGLVPIILARTKKLMPRSGSRLRP